MLLDMITAEQARGKVSIDMISSDMKKAKDLILSAISKNNPATIFIDELHNPLGGKLFNRPHLIYELKKLGYTIRKCPDLDFVFVIQWEESYIEDVNDMTNYLNWDVI